MSNFREATDFIGRILDVPSMVLLVMLIFIIYVCWQAQKKRDDFDFADMLKDENDKANGLRMGTLAALGISSWWVVTATIKGTMTDNGIMIYLCIWSGAKVAEKMIDAWRGVQMGKIAGAASVGTNTQDGASETTAGTAANKVTVTSQSPDNKSSITLTPTPPQATDDDSMPDSDPTATGVNAIKADVNSSDAHDHHHPAKAKKKK